MADRYDWDRNRDRDRDYERERGGHRVELGRGREGRESEAGRWENEGGRDWDRERWSGLRHEDWNRENRGRENWGGREHGGGREDYRREHPGGYGGAYAGGYSPGLGYNSRTTDFGDRGDWGRQGAWGTYGNRPSFNRENEWNESRSDYGRNLRQGEYGRGEFGGFQRENQSEEGGRGESTSQYGRGLGAYGGGAGPYTGGMGWYGERGRFAGRGPKGWQRSDDRIREDINERLTDHPHIDATEIEIQVRNGEVTLTGSVDDRHAKRLAEDIVEGVSGVKEVHNQLRVQQFAQQGAGTGTSGAITTGAGTQGGTTSAAGAGSTTPKRS